MKKRVISMFLLIAMLVSLVPAPAFAEGTLADEIADPPGTQETLAEELAPSEEPEAVPVLSAEHEEAVDDPAEEPESAAESTPAEDSDSDEEAAPTEEVAPTEEPADDAPAEEAQEAFSVSFVCSPAELLLSVYPAADLSSGANPHYIAPQPDGTYLLAAGEYCYTAQCAGYNGIYNEKFTVAENAEINITLDVFEAEGEVEDIADAESSSGVPTKKADVVFVIDSTGSMGDEIRNVVNNLIQFTNALSEIDYRICVVEFKDITCYGEEESTKVLSIDDRTWYTYASNVSKILNTIYVDGGGDAPETTIDALGLVNTLAFRASAKKFAFVLTDDSYKVDNNFGYTDMSDLISALNKTGVCTSVIAPTYYEDTYRDLYEGTGGIFCNIYGNFADALIKLAKYIEDTVTKTAFDPLKDGNSFYHNNSAGCGFEGYTRNVIDDDYFNKLVKNFSRGETNSFKRNVLNTTWGGSCHGIAQTIALVFNDYLSLRDINNSDAKTYYTMPRPCKDTKLLNSIQFYQYLQYSGSIDRAACITSTFSNWLSDVLETLVDRSKDDALMTLSYGYTGFDLKRHGHSIVVAGYNRHSSSGYHIVNLFDENNIGELIEMQISDDFRSFRFVDGNGNTISQYHYNYLSLYDVAELADVRTGNKFEISDISSMADADSTTLEFPAGKPFLLTNAEGEYLEYNGESFRGTMTVLRKAEYGEDSQMKISVPTSESFCFEDISDGVEVSAYNNDCYAAVTGSNIDTATIDMQGKVELTGENYNFDIALSTDSVIDGNETGLVSLSGLAEGSVKAASGNDTVMLVAEREVKGITTAAYIGSSKVEKTIDTPASVIIADQSGETTVLETFDVDRQYLALDLDSAPEQLTALVKPETLRQYITWSVDNGENEALVIDVDANGLVAPRSVGTAYAVATLNYNNCTLTARCRVDVTETPVEDEIEATGVQLGTTAATSELYSRNYAKLDVLLLLPQNDIAGFAAAEAEEPKNNGAAIKSARFVAPAAAEMFDLVVIDDRHVAVVPKDSSIKKAKAVKSSYTSQVAVTVGKTEFVTDAKLKLTVKKTLPKLKAKALQFNSFYSDQTMPVVITGATATAITPDTSKKTAIPTWLTFEDGVFSLAVKAPKKSISGSAYLLVDTEEWAVPLAVTVSVKNLYAAPKLKLSSTNVTFSNVLSSGIQMQLMPISKKDTLAQYNVASMTASNGFIVEDFRTQSGTFTLYAPDSGMTGRITLNVAFDDTDTVIPLTLTVKKKAPTVKLQTSSVTLNPAYGDSAAVNVVVTPADYNGDVQVVVKTAAGIETDELTTQYRDGKLYVQTTGTTKFSSTYKVNVSIPGSKPVVLTVKTSKQNLKPAATLRASGAIDLTHPDSAATIKVTFKNYVGNSVYYDGGSVTVTKGKTAIGTFDLYELFDTDIIGNVITLKHKAGTTLTPGYTYSVAPKIYVPDEDGICVNVSPAKISVKMSPVTVKLSKTSLTLNKLVDDFAQINATSATKGYTLTDPLIRITDKSGKVRADGKLDVYYNDGKLTVSVNEFTEYGTSYKVYVSAGEAYKATVLTVTIPTQARSAVTASVKATGSIDIVRSGSSITLVPTYRNVNSANRSERVEIYSSADKFAKPIYDVIAANDMVLTNICADSRLKYKARVIVRFDNGQEFASPLTAITVKTGSAKLTLTGKPTLYLKDANSRGEFTISSTDSKLNPVLYAQIRDAKYANMFELFDYGNGQFAIGFRKDSMNSAAKLKTVNIPINVWLDGNTNDGAKPNATLTLKLTIAK